MRISVVATSSGSTVPLADSSSTVCVSVEYQILSWIINLETLLNGNTYIKISTDIFANSASWIRKLIVIDNLFGLLTAKLYFPHTGIDGNRLAVFKRFELEGGQVLNSPREPWTFFRLVTSFPACDVIKRPKSHVMLVTTVSKFRIIRKRFKIDERGQHKPN